MDKNFTRRNFIKASSVAGIGLAVTPSFALGNPFKPEKVKIGLIGVGLRGQNHLYNLLQRNDVEVTAICDVDDGMLAKSLELFKKAGAPMPQVYTGDDYAYLDLLERKDIAGVVISTPWLWHPKMAIDTMKAGKYAGLEVSAANTIEDCWDMVNTSEETGSPLMILENVCYRRDIMAIHNMVKQDMFGELIHCHCGYQHDLRRVLFNNGEQPYGGGVEFGPKAYSEAKWRTEHYLKRDGDVYPTHGVGPIANFLDINRGNRFVSLTSTSTKARGLHDYIVKEGGEGHPNAKLKWKMGDVITSTISTANGESIIVIHDTSLPRPYSLGFRVQGTKGIWMKDGNQIYIENISPPHKWEDSTSYIEKYDHPLWKKFEEQATGSGHGGMDFFVLNAFVESVKRQIQPPLDVYDAAAWSVITGLSEQSIYNGGEPQDFPDFTRGRWIKRKPVFGLGDAY
nr:Gfo/Idh/MocA family oxidoreductase [Bacteroidota bacterium]